ncbi:hypothetical protein Tco_0444883 [Tanacetum coccineum]
MSYSTSSSFIEVDFVEPYLTKTISRSPQDDPYQKTSPIDASSGTDESLPAQAAPAIAPESPPTLSPPIAPYR